MPNKAVDSRLLLSGIHLYTMNDAKTAEAIWQATRSLFENGRKVHQV